MGALRSLLSQANPSPTTALAQRLHDAGWLIAPGHLFHADHRPGTLMRINFASSQDARFWRAFDRARG
jgi:DNA-binding transcriptional MocR family regulator